jgi:hypothetical protein
MKRRRSAGLSACRYLRTFVCRRFVSHSPTAQRLRRETTIALAWIAEQLQIGTKTHLAHLLY